jgi:hypothetical protein
VASTPGSARVEVESNPYTLTGDTYSDRSLLGIERRYTIPERIVCTGTGNFNSTIIAPAGVRLLITGMSVEWGAVPAANVSIFLGVVLAGSALLGTADRAFGTFVASTPTLHIPAGAAIGSVVQAHPQGLNLVTREGNAAGVTIRATQANGAGADVTTVTIFLSPVSVSDLLC